MKNKTRYITVPVTQFKYDAETGHFSCYANVKNVIDHAQDRSVDGCFVDSINKHKTDGTMPKMFWMHNPHALPVGPWLDMKEDHVGLFMEGKLSKTTMGTDIEILAKDNALDTFSIGYQVIEEKWNSTLQCNDLIKVHIKEVSWVNFGCNEMSLLQSIKSKLEDGEHLTKSDLRNVLRDTGWFSKRQIERITADYNPTEHNDDVELLDIKDLLENSTLFK